MFYLTHETKEGVLFTSLTEHKTLKCAKFTAKARFKISKKYKAIYVCSNGEMLAYFDGEWTEARDYEARMNQIVSELNDTDEDGATEWSFEHMASVPSVEQGESYDWYSVYSDKPLGLAVSLYEDGTESYTIVHAEDGQEHTATKYDSLARVSSDLGFLNNFLMSETEEG